MYGGADDKNTGGRRVSVAGLAATLAVFVAVVLVLRAVEPRPPAPALPPQAIGGHTQAPAPPVAEVPAGKPAAAPSSPGAKPVETAKPAAPQVKVEIASQKTEKPSAVKPRPRPVRTASAKPAVKRTPRTGDTVEIVGLSPLSPTGAGTGKKPAAKPKTPDVVVKVNKPPAVPPGQTAPQWYSVRLNKLNNKNLADTVATALRSRGFVDAKTKSNSDGTHYVEIGSFTFRYAAEDTKKQLQELGFTDAHIEEKTVAQ